VKAVDALNPPEVRRHRSHDLAVVIPGIMGSRLVDVDSGKAIWDLRRAMGGLPWRRRSALKSLIVSDEERDGRSARVRPAGLMGLPFWVPVLGGFEPYGDLVRELRRASVDDAAVLEFPYDWRLGVEVNAAQLASTLHDALPRWRRHPAQVEAARRHPEERPAAIVLIGHSMGGLVAQALSTVPGGLEDVRAVITLGTPFHGSVRAMELLSHGAGGPWTLSRQALRDVGRTMPGLYDLLPSYPCVFADDQLRRPEPAHIAAIGGDVGLARDTLAARARRAQAVVPGHHLVLGSAQVTPQSVEIRGGEVFAQVHTYIRHRDGSLEADDIGRPRKIDYLGDGTVYLHAAQLPRVTATAIAQQHGALARTPSVIDIAREVARQVDLGIVLGGRELGLTVPASAVPNSLIPVRVRVDDDPHLVEVTVEDTGSSFRETYRRFRVDESDLVFNIDFPVPGLYRVLASQGDDPVSSLVLVGAETDGDAG
jgi:pimeloyl-ACP methyl ester carboxylesterase